MKNLGYIFLYSISGIVVSLGEIFVERHSIGWWIILLVMLAFLTGTIIHFIRMIKEINKDLKELKKQGGKNGS